MKHVDNAVCARKSIYATDKGSRNASYQRVGRGNKGDRKRRQEERLFLVDRVPMRELYTSAEAREAARVIHGFIYCAAPTNARPSHSHTSPCISGHCLQRPHAVAAEADWPWSSWQHPFHVFPPEIEGLPREVSARGDKEGGTSAAVNSLPPPVTTFSGFRAGLATARTLLNPL